MKEAILLSSKELNKLISEDQIDPCPITMLSHAAFWLLHPVSGRNPTTVQAPKRLVSEAEVHVFLFGT